MNWAGLFGLLGMTSICMLLLVMALLSRRLGTVTKAAPYYRGFYLAAIFVAIGVGARIIHLQSEVAQIEELHQNIKWVLLYNGAPTLGVTIGLVVAWRYWSWLLAERN